MKAQISMEYMMVVGFVALITVPLVIIYYTETEDMTEQIAASQADNILRKVVDSAEVVYYLGEPSKTTLKVYVPSHINGSKIENREVMYYLKTVRGVSELMHISSINVSGDLPITEGLHTIELEASGNSVVVSHS